ncbi:hypothetical protein [Nonomuraea dietziae]|uniref:hypothetical protein n=1 Tax=Nonomuraea dietziae TaxID=65515 RepID=UPI0033FAC8CE
MQRLDVSVETQARRTVVHVRGEVDLATAELLGAVLDQIAAVGGPCGGAAGIRQKRTAPDP